ncbi:hypothetical protein TWF694_003570 [Orbilia ellipsospora]|uniref:Uncharacterized protein n=1 Tax=Orbilia ellipsospora TaxID=2528407 RepID=A0AAV9X121_9PEZI
MAGINSPTSRSLLVLVNIVNYLQPATAYFWLKATTIVGEHELDIDQFLSVATLGKPLNLANWQHCVDFDYKAGAAGLKRKDLDTSLCSFAADNANGVWTIKASSDPVRIDPDNKYFYDSASRNEAYRPRIAFASIFDRAWNTQFDYLTMGSGVPGQTLSENTVAWNIYRPVTQKSEKFGRDTGRRVPRVANGDDATFGNIRDFAPNEQIEPTAVASGYPGLVKYFGNFGVQEITGGAVQQGDFVVIRGGGTHIQACFQEMNGRAADGSIIKTVKPSFLELYVQDFQPGPRDDVVGCKEVIFRVVTEISLRNDPSATASEQDMMVNSFDSGPNEVAQITIPKYEFTTPSGGTHELGSPDEVAASKAKALGFSILSQDLANVFEAGSQEDETASMKEALASIFEGSDTGLANDWLEDDYENPTSPEFGELEYERSPDEGGAMEEEKTEEITGDIKIEEPLPSSQAPTERLSYDSEDLFCEEAMPKNLQRIIRAETFSQIPPNCSPMRSESPKLNVEQKSQGSPQELTKTGWIPRPDGIGDIQVETPDLEREGMFSDEEGEEILQIPKSIPQITPQQQHHPPGWIGHHNSLVGVYSERDPNPQWLPSENEFFESNDEPGMETEDGQGVPTDFRSGIWRNYGNVWADDPEEEVRIDHSMKRLALGERERDVMEQRNWLYQQGYFDEQWREPPPERYGRQVYIKKHPWPADFRFEEKYDLPEEYPLRPWPWKTNFQRSWEDLQRKSRGSMPPPRMPSKGRG